MRSERKSLPVLFAARTAWFAIVQFPISITFRGMSTSDAVEARIREKIEWLAKYYDRIMGCAVVVEAPHHHSHQGNLFAVTVRLRVPSGPSIVVGRLHHDDHSHEDVYVAVRDTFDAARRRLQDHLRKTRGDVKAHDVPPHGRVAWIDQAGRYGFIAASDATEIYFHENALVDVAFDDLRTGDEVRFVVHAGEGAKGPQASTVERIGKHHPTE